MVNLPPLPPPTGLGVGKKIRLISGLCDPTVNLNDWYICTPQQPLVLTARCLVSKHSTVSRAGPP
jgi:hypothetical protein